MVLNCYWSIGDKNEPPAVDASLVFAYFIYLFYFMILIFFFFSLWADDHLLIILTTSLCRLGPPTGFLSIKNSIRPGTVLTPFVSCHPFFPCTVSIVLNPPPPIPCPLILCNIPPVCFTLQPTPLYV